MSFFGDDTNSVPATQDDTCAPIGMIYDSEHPFDSSHYVDVLPDNCSNDSENSDSSTPVAICDSADFGFSDSCGNLDSGSSAE